MTTALRADADQGLAWATRAGLVAYGLLHLLVAWVAVELALGDRHHESSGQGALRQLTDQQLGHALVWAIAVAMLAFCLSRVIEGFVGHRDEGRGDRWRHRARAWGQAVAYGAIGGSALAIATTSGGGGSRTERSLTARVLDHPGGVVVLVLVALVILAVGLHHTYRGLTRDFRDELSAGGRTGEAGTVYLAFGQVGHTAKGVVIILVGGLVAYAGLSHHPRKSGGLDETLRTVRDQPFGPALLVAVAAGIACYGLFCFAQARHLSR
ncbi:MAG: DUF1206 domain-containing protein [Nocardioidaceae bacterium]|nr:DUF1206 domain-containing protein [Nocardioidaceae bacterium]